MATIKSFTDIEQSKKLAEILPPESADMYRVFENNAEARVYYGKTPTAYFVCEPCWSLAALIGILPNSLIYTPNPALDGYCCKNIMHDLETYGDNPIDACYEMIIKLNELNLL